MKELASSNDASAATESSQRLSDQPGERNKARSWISGLVKDAAVPIIVATSTFGGAYWGANLAYQGGRENLQAQILEERSRVEKEKRAEVYVDFLDKASGYATQYSRVVVRCAPNGLTPTDSTHAKAREEAYLLGCLSSDEQVANAWDGLHRARSEVFVYGSSQANSAATAIMGELPLEANRNLDPIPAFAITSNTYARFQQVMCMELPSNSRNDC